MCPPPLQTFTNFMHLPRTISLSLIHLSLYKSKHRHVSHIFNLEVIRLVEGHLEECFNT